ncbi:MAG: FAD-dependent oxidoreductase, partial [Deltaproteobacteria bacterium]|nr:FAD-dependent oxidoreductase [Deltaproteobacteria bacterium]
MTDRVDVVVVGAGVFGLTAALELRRRGRTVRVLDPGPVPHPLAASTDRSKIVRLDYGADEAYTAWMETALARWRQWPGDLFEETGILFLSRAAMAAGGFEHDSLDVLRRRGHAVQRMEGRSSSGEREAAEPELLRRRFPVWNADAFADGYFNPQGGWAHSGRVVAWLAAEARAAGVEVTEGVTVARLHESSSRVTGAALHDGSLVAASEAVVVAAGAWTPHVLPETASFLRSPGQPVFLLRPENPAPFVASRFPVWAADIANTGWYGFPIGDDGILKIARHGAGRLMHPESPDRVVTAQEESELRDFLRWALPSLVDAPIASHRVCLYSDSPDGHLWIARDPDRPGLVLATGDSGHAFKLAPLLGEWAADAVEGRDSDALRRFRWRA